MKNILSIIFILPLFSLAQTYVDATTKDTIITGIKDTIITIRVASTITKDSIVKVTATTYSNQSYKISIPFTTIKKYSQTAAQSFHLSLQKSDPVILSGKTNVVIENLRFENITGVMINISNSSNITIRNCFFNKGSAEAISVYRGVNIAVENCLFNGVTTGVYALQSQTIKITGNQFVNVRQRSGRGHGQFVQFNTVTGAGNAIENNKGENFAGESDPEDLISLFSSSGTATSPISIRNNMFRGGGPSTSGGGIMTGDYGGGYVAIEGNVLMNPGQYGMAIAGGHDIKISNNKIYSTKFPWSNNPLYVWAQQGTACSNNYVAGNYVFWIDKNGVANNGWNAGNCPGTIYNPGENKPITEAEMNVPAHLITFVTPDQILTIRK